LSIYHVAISTLPEGKNDMSIFHIAIDGPVAGGKGTIARGLSDSLGIPCLDTGAIYRGIAVACAPTYKINLSKDNINEAVVSALNRIKITAKVVNNVTRIYIDGKDVTDKLRENDISQIASQVGTIPEVRKLCTKVSQELAANQSLIAEGRDICSVVLPNAKHKFYLTAKVKIRAKRRYDELIAKGRDITFKQVLRETKERDKRDSKKGGLVKTPDAVLIDSTNMTIDETVQHMLKLISR